MLVLKLVLNFASASPKGYEPNAQVVANAKLDAAQSGSTIEILNDPFAAAKDADILYTDVWASMGQEAEHDERVKILQRLSNQ